MANESTNGNAFIEKIKGIVDANLENEKFNLSSLARESGLSKITLYRKIKAATGKTTSQFIREIRLTKAKELLLDEELTVAEVAYKVGFGSATYFNKCFHEYYGCSPGEYKKTHQYQDTNQPKNKILKILALSISIVIAVVAVFTLKHEAQTENVIEIIVSPIEFSGSSENEFWAIGINEVIINELSAIKNFLVLDQKIIDDYISTTGNEKKLNKKAVRAYTLKLTMFEKDGIRIIVWRLTRNHDGAVVHSQKDTIPKTVSYVTEKLIVKTIATKLDIPISDETKQRLQINEPINRTAEKYYLQALKILNGNEIKRNQDLYKAAENYLYKALDADSLFYKAYEELASIHATRNYWLNIHQTNFMDSSLYFANKAIQISQNSYKGHYIRASYYYHRNDTKKALEELDAATNINQSYVYAYELKGKIYRYIDLAKCIENYHWAVQLSGEVYPQMLHSLSFHYSEAGFFDESKYYAKLAFEIDNDSVLWYMSLAGYENANRNNQKGTAYFLKAYAINPLNSNLLLLLGKAYSDAEQYEQAARYFDEYIDFLEQRNAIEGLGVVHRPAYVYWQIGKKEEAAYYFDLQIKNTLKDLDLKRPFHQFRLIDIAEVYAFNEEKEKAYKYLQFIIDQPVCIPFWLYDIVKNDPQFDKIRNESQFIALEKRYRDRFEMEHQKVKNWISENSKFN
ncbi:helix-turn-helix domain-containing protein [uncultured Draconibacterium sp.]|uniref:helix-turn-helix domain-containing protein n=1 Tax=uncultured Draconibacterium sp. TaxID=1573823 RepID=UPI0025E1584A|nr:helix-turn-helix domain-containing protein [uncultured Draconibacterium sp.]